MMTISRRSIPVAAALVLTFVVAACRSSEKIPPKGSKVTVGANPATIALTSRPECLILLGVLSCGTADVVATVASEMDVPLPDQDVRFRTTAGFLFTGTTLSPVDAANIPIRTDEFGNAHVNLITSTTATVTAQSGSASGTLSISTVVGNLSTILLNNDTTSSGCSTSTTTVTSCSQTICVEAQAQNSTGAGIQGVVLLFDLQNNVSGSNTFNGVFTPSQATTDSSGSAFAKFTPDSTCPAQCGGGKACQAEMIVSTTGGGIQSAPVQLQINIP
jgi:hypothetical protein